MIPVAAAMQAALAGSPGEDGGGEAGAETGPDDFPGGFDRALEKVLAGEGGEGGRGLTKMMPSVTSPALRGFQISKAITGNTLRTYGGSAIHYDPAGSLSGWMGSWTLASSGKCPGKTLTEDYFNGAKGCYKMTRKPVTGTWSVEGDKLCRVVTTDGVTKKGCSHVALLLDTFGLFDSETGTMSGKGFKLLPGKQI